MLRIAICDDDQAFLSLTVSVIGQWKNKPLDLILETFDNGDSLILSHNETPFDIVFLDPPFHKGIIDTILTPLIFHLKPGAYVYLETEHGVKLPEKWETLREQTTRQVQYRLIQYKGS